MDWAELTRLLLFWLPAISTALAIYVWHQRPALGANFGALALVAVTWWTLCYALQLSAGADLVTQLWWAKHRQLGVVATIPFVLLASLTYTDRARWVTPTTWVVLWVVPIVTVLGVYTNELHGLYWKSVQLDTTDPLAVLVVTRGPLNFLHIVYSYVVLLLAALTLIRWAITHYHQLYRGQAIALTISVLAPWAANSIYLAGLSRIDLTPYGMTITSVAIVWAFMGYRVLDLAPMARDRLIEGMSDGVLVVDRLDRIVDSNPAFLKIVGLPPGASLVGQPVARVFDSRPDLVEKFCQTEVMQTEISYGVDSQFKVYDLRTSILSDAHGQMSGRLIVLRDITVRKQADDWFRALLEAAPVAMIAVDQRGLIKLANRQIEEMFGYSRPDLYGEQIEKLIPERYQATHVKQRANYRHDLRLRPMGTDQYLLGRRQRGEEFPVEIMLSSLEIGGELLTVATVRDITQRHEIETRLQRQTRVLESLYEIALDLFNRRNIDDLLHIMVDRATRLLEADQAMIGLLEDNQTLVARAATPGHPIRVGGRSQRGDGLSPEWQAIESHQPIVIANHRSKSHQHLIDDDQPVMAVADVPILRESEVIGVLSLVRERPRPPFDENDLREAGLLAQMIGLALDNARLYQEAQNEIRGRQRVEDSLQRQNQYLAALHAISLDLLNRRDAAELLQAIITDATQLLEASYGELLLAEGDTLVIRSMAPTPTAAIGSRIPRGQGLLSWRAFDSHQIVSIDDYSTWPLHRDFYDDLRLRAVASIPIVAGQKCLGLLDLARTQPNYPFDEDQLRVASWFAQLAALVLENSDLYSAVQKELAERRVVENELQTQRDFALQVMNSMGQGLVITDAKGEYEYINPAAGELVGIDPESGLGKTAFDFTLVEDHAKIARVRAARERGESVSYDIRLIKPDGSEVFALVNSVPRRKDSTKYEGSIAVVTDLTERRRAEQAVAEERSRLRALIESSRDGIVFVGLDRIVRVVNAPALQLLHLPGQPKDWQNRSILAMVNALRPHNRKVAQIIVAGMRRIQQGDETPDAGYYEMSPYWVEWLNLPVTGEAHSLGRLLRLRDITQERLTEKMREDVMHMMVHDLRNPVTGILASLELLELDTSTFSADGLQVLGIARQSGEQLLRLVSEILDINRLESGRLPIEPQHLALAVVVKDALNRQRPVATSKGLHIEKSISRTLPFVSADRGLLDRVLQNLIGNALKFTPVNGKMRVSAKVSVSDPAWLEVSVSNTGAPISPELAERLFQKFASGHQPGSGSGLGLAFCRLAIEAHGGRIWVETDTANETVFKFTLPIVQ